MLFQSIAAIGLIFFAAWSVSFAAPPSFSEDTAEGKANAVSARMANGQPGGARANVGTLPRQANISPPVASSVEPGAAPVGMSAEDFQQLAEQNNPTLVQAAARIQAAQAECVQAGLYLNPNISYKANDINVNRHSGQQGAYFSQEFVTGGKLKQNQAVAAHAVEQCQHAWEAQRQRIITDVKRAFYDVLIAQVTMELNDELVRLEWEGVRAAESLFAAKEVGRVDVLQARVEANTANILAEKARNRHLAAWHGLVVVCGVPDMPTTKLLGNLESEQTEISWDATVSRILNESPEMAEARSGVSRAEAAVARENAARIPNITAAVGVYHDNDCGESVAEVQAGIPLPLFNRNQGNIRKAQAEVIAARHEVRRKELELQQRCAAVFEQYKNARCQVTHYSKDILPDAHASLELALTGYRQGELNYLPLLTAQRTYYHAHLAYIDALRDLHNATIAMEGNLLTDSLQPTR
jgi:cobalt-zinc-cadmium efflux system outer membrane protein